MISSFLIILSSILIPTTYAITFPTPIAFLVHYRSENQINQFFNDVTQYDTSDPILYIPDPTPTYLIRGTGDTRTFQWSRDTTLWKIRNVRLLVYLVEGERLIAVYYIIHCGSGSWKDIMGHERFEILVDGWWEGWG